MTGVFVVIGLLVALLSPVEYEVNATLLPESQSMQGGVGGLLEQYGGLLGMSGNLSLDQEGNIPPQLYPNIVQSLPFQLELLNTRVAFPEFDTTTTVYTFFDEIHTPSVFSYITGYTIGLPGKIMGLFREEALEQPLPRGFATDSIISVTKDQMSIIGNMQERVTISYDEATGVINLTAVMPDPNAAAQIGKVSINLVKEYITNYHTRKAKKNLEYIQEQLADVRQRFVDVQNQLAEFRDNNLNLVTAKAQAREQRLQSEYDLAFSVYNTVAQQVEQAKLKVQEQIPVVSILQPIRVPLDDTKSGVLILIGFMFGGAIASIVYLYVRIVLIDKPSS